MKTIIKLLLISFISLCVYIPAAADLIFYEGFDYSTGSLAGQNGGTGFSSTWNSGTVIANGLNYTDANGMSLIVSGGAYQANTGGHFRDISNALDANSSGTYWLTYLFRPDAETPSGWGGGLSFFTGTGTGTSGENLFTGTVLVSANNRYRIQSYSPSSTASTTSAAQPLWEVGRTDFIVVRLDLSPEANSDTIRFWVNPLLDSAPENDTAWLTLENRNVLAERIRLGHSYQASFDELRFGTSWNSVAPIPEPAVVLLLVLACFLTLIGRRILDPDCRRVLFSR